MQIALEDILATYLNPPLVFGPVYSRRLGISLGLNLMPGDGKICNFDCIYCENGLNAERKTRAAYPKAAELADALEKKLREMATEDLLPDVITLAGNGEPTANPEFPQVVNVAVSLRNQLAPKARLAVLSNGTLAHVPRIHDALLQLDDNIQKLDTVDMSYIRLVNRPAASYDVQRVIEALAAFHGQVIVQTAFMKGSYQGQDLDNTTPKYVEPWLDALRYIKPQAVTIYAISRDMPVEGIVHIGPEVLDRIKSQVEALGIPCIVGY